MDDSSDHPVSGCYGAVRPAWRPEGPRASRFVRLSAALVSAVAVVVVCVSLLGNQKSSLVEGGITESPRQVERAFIRAEKAILHYDQPLVFAKGIDSMPHQHVEHGTVPVQSRIAIAAASIKRLSVRKQELAPAPPVARTSQLPEEGTAGYNAGGSHMGHAPGFMGQYYFLGTNVGPSGFADYDNVKATAESFPKTIDFKNSADFSSVDPDLQNGQIAARWIGKIEIKEAGNYKFRSKSANASWVYVDGQLVVENNDEGTATGDKMFLSQGYHAFRAEFFANTKDENMVVEYKGTDTDDAWKLVDGVHRTDFDYLNALSLDNLPDPRPDQLPMGSSRNTWRNIVANKRNMIFCFSYFHYLRSRENCVHDFTGGPLLE